MPYLYCDRCRLQIRIQAAFMRIENCPRCLARSATVTPLELSAARVAPRQSSRSSIPPNPLQPRVPADGLG